MKFRIGSIQDLQQISNLAIKDWSQFKSQLTPENWEKFYQTLNNQQLYEALIAQSQTFIVENDENQVIAFVFYTSSGHPNDVFSADEAYFRMLTVSLDYGGHGLGTQLVEKCINQAKTDQEKFLAVETSEMNSSARRLYEKLGFKIKKEMPLQFGKRQFVYELKI